MASDRDIGKLLEELGFGDPAAQQQARAALEEAGLTHRGKSRLAEEKVLRARALLEARFSRVCGDPICRAALAASHPGRTLLTVADSRGCELCAGSDNRRAVLHFAEACRACGVSRVVVVGGSPNVRSELQSLAPTHLQLRLIDGTERRTLDRARADVEWAHVIFVWGSSELDHRVSKLYAVPAARRKLVPVARRGLAALLTAGVEHLRRSVP